MRLAPMGIALAALTAPAHAEPARFDWFRYEGRPQEHAVAGPGAYRNPILPGYQPDPSITRVGDDYYVVTSSFTHFPGLPIWHSRDLVNWKQIGNAIDRPGMLDFTGLGVSRGVFAPDISHHAGLFYIVNTCVDCGGNFVITARDPAGPWSDPVWLPFDGIDPSISWDGDTAYILNNGPPDEPPRYDGHRAIWIQRFDWRTLKMTGPRTQLVNGGVNIAAKPVWIEGPHLLKHDGAYYLTAAEGGTAENHSQVVFRGPAPTGPFTPYTGNPILTQRGLEPQRPNPITAAGHAKLVQTAGGDWWATFLAFRPYQGELSNIGRETFLLPVTWRDGWPHILPAGETIPFTAPRPRLPSTAPTPPQPDGAINYTDEFDAPRLAPQWIGVRTPKAPFHRIENGELLLTGAAPLGDMKGVPAFLGRRQQHHIATISTRVTFAPLKESDRAGLVAMQSDRSFLFFGLARNRGARVVTLTLRDKADEDRLVASAPVPDGPVTLTIRANGGEMAFDYGIGGITRTLAPKLDTRFLSTQRAGGFVGTVIGPYAYSEPTR